MLLSPVLVTVDVKPIVDWIVRVYILDIVNPLIVPFISQVLRKADEVTVVLVERLAHLVAPFSAILSNACINSMSRSKLTTKSGWNTIYKCLLYNVFQKKQRDLIYKQAIEDLKTFEPIFYSTSSDAVEMGIGCAVLQGILT
jgi:hypothetical protein